MLANAVVLLGGWRLEKCLRQQAGSYRKPRRRGEIGTCRTQSVRGGITTRSVGTIRSNSNSSSNSDSKSFPANAGPTVEVGATFSGYTRCSLVGPASAGKLLILILILTLVHKKPRQRPTRLGCRPNADDAQWAEPHGCGESAARTWMSVRRGPTERRRSEGTPTKEGPNQEQEPLVTWGFIK